MRQWIRRVDKFEVTVAAGTLEPAFEYYSLDVGELCSFR
jgi:hypothetical protein